MKPLELHWEGKELWLSSAEGLEWHGTVPNVKGKITHMALGHILMHIANTKPEMLKSALHLVPDSGHHQVKVYTAYLQLVNSLVVASPSDIHKLRSTLQCEPESSNPWQQTISEAIRYPQHEQ